MFPSSLTLPIIFCSLTSILNDSSVRPNRALNGQNTAQDSLVAPARSNEISVTNTCNSSGNWDRNEFTNSWPIGSWINQSTWTNFNWGTIGLNSNESWDRTDAGTWTMWLATGGVRKSWNVSVNASAGFWAPCLLSRNTFLKI